MYNYSFFHFIFFKKAYFTERDSAPLSLSLPRAGGRELALLGLSYRCWILKEAIIWKGNPPRTAHLRPLSPLWERDRVRGVSHYGESVSLWCRLWHYVCLTVFVGGSKVILGRG